MGIEPYSKLANDLIDKYGGSYEFLVCHCASYDENRWQDIDSCTIETNTAMKKVERDCASAAMKSVNYDLSVSNTVNYQANLTESIFHEKARITTEIKSFYPGLSAYQENIANEHARIRKESSMLRVKFERINHEITHNDLVIKHAVNGFVPTDKILEYKKQKTKPTTAKPEELKESERNSLLKLVLGMAIDAYGYDPYKLKNTSSGGKNGSIQAALSRGGLELDQKTINKYLKEANEKNPATPRKY